MKSDRWDELVSELDAKAATDPRGYKRSVLRWAIGGYAVLLSALLLALAVVVGVAIAVMAGAGALLVKLAIPALFLALVIARSLSVKIAPPEGIELTPADAPALFETIERLRDRLGAPRPDHVLLDGDLNASIVQIPRLGPRTSLASPPTASRSCARTSTRPIAPRLRQLALATPASPWLGARQRAPSSMSTGRPCTGAPPASRRLLVLPSRGCWSSCPPRRARTA